MNKSVEIIIRIQDIIKKYGSFSTSDLESESSPIINSIGRNIVQLAEKFYKDYIETTVYVHDNSVDYIDVIYESLDEDILYDILLLAEQYEVEQRRTEKRTSN